MPGYEKVKTKSRTESKLRSKMKTELIKICSDKQFRWEIFNANNEYGVSVLCDEFKSRHPNFCQEFYKKEIDDHQSRWLVFGVLFEYGPPEDTKCVKKCDDYRKKYQTKIDALQDPQSQIFQESNKMLWEIAVEVIEQYMNKNKKLDCAQSSSLNSESIPLLVNG